MEAGFWHQRWAEGRIGFHQTSPTTLLLKHWAALQLPTHSRVFVPLCGKSLDMAWLAAQGHRVLGVEVSPLAIDAFFEEHALTPAVHASRLGRHHVAGDIELIAGDAFALDADALAECAGVFDRAALIALPPAMRQRYAAELYGALPAGCRGLLITLQYPQHEKDGPPFSVDEAEVRALLAPQWRVDLLERRPIPPDHPGYVAGVSTLETCVYALEKH